MSLSTDSTISFMKIALEKADAAANRGDGPIGTVLVDLNTNRLIIKGSNSQNSTYDPTAHAEINVIRMSCGLKKSPYLSNCALIVTTEPCTMCISACIKAKIPIVYYGVSIEELIAHRFKLMPMSAHEITAKSPHPIKLVGGILLKECLAQRIKFHKPT